MTYTLKVTLGTGANSVATATLTVQVAPDPATSTLGVSSIGANPINPGSSTFLSGNFCFGCTATINPVVGTLPSTSSPYLVNTGSLQTTTVFTLSVTNQAGDSATKTTTVTVNRPTITSFTGPSSFTAGKAGLPLTAVFGGGAGVSGAIVATAGTTTSTCTPPTSTTSPQSFNCTAITQDTTYTLTVTLGTGSNSTATATVVVKLAPTQSITAGTMLARFGAALALLPNGKVLIAGGSPNADGSGAVDTAHVFDPTTGTFAQAGQGGTCTVPANQHMISARYQGTATLLSNGKILTAGGTTDGTNGNIQRTADLYDATTDCFAATGSMGAGGRARHTATALPNGNVLFAGGTDNAGVVLQTAELYTGAAFTPVGGLQSTLNVGRSSATATLLNNGLVLIAGGTASVQKADLFDHIAGTNGQFSQTSGAMQANRSQHTSTLLGDGTVLFVGGAGSLSSAEVFSPATGNFTSTPGALVVGRSAHTATLMPAGVVLIAGGVISGGGATTRTEVFDPANKQFSTAAPLSVARAQHVDTFLFNGTAVLMGGNVAVVNGDLYTP